MDPLAASEYADALPLLEAAIADLAKGQLVRDDRYAMMDLMTAIEVNDAHTDTFLHAQNERGAHPVLPPFDPAVLLAPQDVVWVHDQVLRLEATFHAGHPLSSTLWTCNYLRAPSLAALSGLAPSTSTAPAEKPSELQTIVLRALLLGILKTSEIVWEELSKSQVYEASLIPVVPLRKRRLTAVLMQHEDVHLTLGALSFNALMASCFLPGTPPAQRPSPLLVPGQQGPSPGQATERTVSVDDVLRALDDALRWLQADEQVEADWLSADLQEALVARIMLRIDLLYPIALLTFPAHTSPSSISHHFARIQSYASLFPSAATLPPMDPFSARPALLAAFLPSPTVPLLATQQPPRPVVPLALDAAYDLVRALVADLETLMQLWERWRVGQARWPELHEWSRARGRAEAVPYVRSLQQSLIATPTHLFAAHPLSAVSTSLFRTLTPLPASLFSLLPHLVAREAHPSQPAHRLDAFLARVAAKVAQHGPHQAGQNRARQRRWVVKSLAAWGALVREADAEAAADLQVQGRADAHATPTGGAFPAVRAAVDRALPLGDSARVDRGLPHVARALTVLAGELALDALLSGFETSVGLFVAGGEEAAQAWWVAERVARRVKSEWARLVAAKEDEEEGLAYLRAKASEAEAVGTVCRACWLATQYAASARPQPTFSSPVLPPLAIHPAAAERGRFRQRFEWLDNLPTPSGVAGKQELADWEAYRTERDALEQTTLEQQSKAACLLAVTALGALALIPPSERGFVSALQVKNHRLGPLSALPSSAFGLPTEPPYLELATLLSDCGGRAH